MWQEAVPKIALSKHFLLHGILSLAALHLARLEPSRAANLYSQAVQHHQNGLGIFRTTITNITQDNCDACFLFSVTLAMYQWASTNGKGSLFFSDVRDGETTVDWARVLRGVRMLENAWGWIHEGPLLPMFQNTPEGFTPDELALEDQGRFDALPQLWLSDGTGFTPEDISALDEALKLLVKYYRMAICAQAGVNHVAAVFTWPIEVSNHFIELIHKRAPAALILLAHFCLLLNRIDTFWWNQGMSRHLLQTVHQTLGREWESWIRWPLQELIISEFENSGKNVI